MSGQLVLANTSGVDLSDWSFTFVTTQSDVQVWSSTSEVVDLGNGLFEVTVAPPSWGTTIPAGGSISLSFNATSVGLPTSGALTDEMFFVDEADSTPVPEPVPVPTPEPELVPEPEPQPRHLSKAANQIDPLLPGHLD